jgi:hypothetical protein
MQIRTLKHSHGSANRIVLIPFLVEKLGDESRYRLYLSYSVINHLVVNVKLIL